MGSDRQARCTRIAEVELELSRLQRQLTQARRDHKHRGSTIHNLVGKLYEASGSCQYLAEDLERYMKEEAQADD